MPRRATPTPRADRPHPLGRPPGGGADKRTAKELDAVAERFLAFFDRYDYLVKVGNQTTIVAIALLAVGLTGILVLISNFIFGGVVPIVVGALAAGLVSGLWFGIPLNRRRAL